MLIITMDWRGVRVPLQATSVAPQDPTPSRNSLLLWIGSDDGTVGIGEAPPPGLGSPEDVAYLARMLHELAPSAMGMDPGLALDIISAVAPRSPLGDSFRFGMETAIFDLMGRQSVRPVADMLGGVIDWVPVTAVIEVTSPEDAAAQAGRAVEQGYACVNVSLGAHIAELDVEVVRQVREAIGPDVLLRVDVHEHWGVDEAIEMLRRLEPFDLDYVQQPVAGKNLRGMAKIRRSGIIPVAAVEAVGTEQEAEDVIAAEAADVLIVRPAKVGGIRPAYTIMEMAREHGLKAVIAASLETGVGLSASLHLASAFGPASPSGLAAGLALVHDLLEAPLVPVRGHITVPQTPGLGLRLNTTAVDRYTTNVMGSVAALGRWYS